MFTEAFFTTAKIWKQSKCPLVEKWIMIWYTHTHIYMSVSVSDKKEWNTAIFNNVHGLRGYYIIWKKSEKDKYHGLSLICIILKTKQNKHRLIDTENKWVVAREREREDRWRGWRGSNVWLTYKSQGYSIRNTVSNTVITLNKTTGY